MISTNKTLETWANLPGANVAVEVLSDNSVTITLKRTANDEDYTESTEIASLCFTEEQAGILISKLATGNIIKTEKTGETEKTELSSVAGSVSKNAIALLYSAGRKGVYTVALGDGASPTAFVCLTHRQLDDICTQWGNRRNQAFPPLNRDYPEAQKTVNALLDASGIEDTKEEEVDED